MPKGTYKRMSPWTVANRTLLLKSCSRCHQQRQGSDYMMRPDGFRHSVCKFCQHASAKIADKKANKESQKKATNYRQFWSSEDVRILKQMTEAGKSAREIGEKLGRSIAAVYVARTKYL